MRRWTPKEKLQIRKWLQSKGKEIICPFGNTTMERTCIKCRTIWEIDSLNKWCPCSNFPVADVIAKAKEMLK